MQRADKENDRKILKIYSYVNSIQNALLGISFSHAIIPKKIPEI